MLLLLFLLEEAALCMQSYVISLERAHNGARTLHPPPQHPPAEQDNVRWARNVCELMREVWQRCEPSAWPAHLELIAKLQARSSQLQRAAWMPGHAWAPAAAGARLRRLLGSSPASRPWRP